MLISLIYHTRLALLTRILAYDTYLGICSTYLLSFVLFPRHASL